MSGGLPKGWEFSEIGQLCDLVNGRAFKVTEWSTNQGLPIIRIQNLNNPAANFNYFQGDLDPKHKVMPGSLLFAWSGTPGTSFGAHEWKGLEGALNQHIYKIDFCEKLISKAFFKYAINQKLDELIGKAQGAVGLRHVTKSSFVSTTICFPPLNEQIRIANKLDRLLAKVDAAQTRLERIPTLLKRFRQAVLAAATSGELSREWRENSEHKSAQIIDFIQFWKNEYISQNRKYSPPKFSPSIGYQDEVPPTWQKTYLGHICDVFVGATPSRKEKSYWGEGFNWVSSSEVAFCRIGSTKESITSEGLKHTSTNVHPAGTVMLAMIGQGKTRGQAAILDIAACHNQNTAALRVPKGLLISEYLYFFLCFKYEENRNIGGGNNQQALNKATVQGIAFPYPPIEEQKEIVRRVDALFALADAVEKQYTAAKQRLDRLSQSLLAKAFRGELVPQDPNDEPASELLKRIQAERAANVPGKKGRKVTSQTVR